MGAASSLAPKIGPLGLSPKKVRRGGSARGGAGSGRVLHTQRSSLCFFQWLELWENQRQRYGMERRTASCSRQMEA